MKACLVDKKLCSRIEFFRRFRLFVIRRTAFQQRYNYDATLTPLTPTGD